MAGVRLSDASDERLVELARAGDEQAFAAIVERYRAPLLRYCLGYLPGAAAEDARQQTFINAYRALSDPERDAPAALRPWLYRVARNAALNVARDPQSGLDELPADLDGVRRPDEVVQGRERFQRVVGAVSALPPKQRQVLVRHALDGESHERIATDLGMSAGSIRQLAHRARQTVRAATAALIPLPLTRFMPLGADASEVASGAALAKVAVAAVVVGAAGGGAVQVVREDEKPAAAEARKAPEQWAAPQPRRSAPLRDHGAPAPTPSVRPGGGESSGRNGSGRGKGSERSGSGSSGPGSSGSGSSGPGSSGSGSSGPGSSGSGSSGSVSSGSGSSGSDSSGSGSSGSGSSGSGSSGSDLDSSGSGSSGSGDDSSGSDDD